MEQETSLPQRPAGGKAPAASARRKREQLAHRWTRFGVQAMFFVLTPGLFASAFNGVKYLLGQIGATEPIEFVSFLAVLVALLAFTVVFGRFFCGYACAFGTLGDVLYAAGEFLRSKTPVPRVKFPEPLVRVLSLVKYVILVGICVACFAGAWQTVSHDSPWVAFAGFTSGSLEGIEPAAFALLGLVALGMLLRERSFCQFLCPMGAVFSLMPVLGFSEFTRTRAHCAPRCGRCHDVCPVSIWPDADALAHGECISCGRCADACPMRNINLVSVPKAGEQPESRPQRKTSEKWWLLRGTGAGVVLAKAVLLLTVCWAIGATRYLPPIPFG
ncbi:MAG: 4Fe-4S binding protein [Eggerthellaceae bacterium]|nr:4Fe-4S binding protein [Eggerthellaceae bacterium]